MPITPELQNNQQNVQDLQNYQYQQQQQPQPPPQQQQYYQQQYQQPPQQPQQYQQPQQPQQQYPQQQPQPQPQPEPKKKGIEAKVASMDPKLKKLYSQILSITMVVLILYAVLSIVFTVVINGAPFMAWFNTADFTTCVVGLVVVGIAYKILSGGSISVPDNISKKQGQGQKQFNFPDTWGVKKQKSILMGQPQQTWQPPQQQQHQQPQPQYQQPPQPQQQRSGSWRCPNCQAIVIGSPAVCNRCGYRRV